MKGKSIIWALVIGVSSAFILQRGQTPKSNALTHVTPVVPVEKSSPKPRKPKSYSEALAISEQTGRPIVLVFKTNSCVWCEKLQETLKNPKVKDVLSEYVYYEVSWEKHPLLCERYKITGYPAYRMIEVSGGKENIIKSGTGYKDPDAFIGWIILDRRGKP